jgi:hypothetical protein
VLKTQGEIKSYPGSTIFGIHGGTLFGSHILAALYWTSEKMGRRLFIRCGEAAELTFTLQREKNDNSQP